MKAKFRHTIPLVTGIGILVFLFFFLISVNWIGYSVKSRCQAAQKQYEGNCIEALIYFTQDENNSFEDRNSAVWALGQLADERALPFLKNIDQTSFKTIPCKLSEHLCHYEIEKAIRWCTEGNITNWFHKTFYSLDV